MIRNGSRLSSLTSPSVLVKQINHSIDSSLWNTFFFYLVTRGQIVNLNKKEGRRRKTKFDLVLDLTRGHQCDHRFDSQFDRFVHVNLIALLSDNDERDETFLEDETK